MDAAGNWLPARLGEVEALLRRVASGHGASVGDYATATLDAGGKRLRPLLVLLSAGPEAGDRSVAGACAVELIHMATLVHDDVLDEAPLRRGRPTVFAEAGRERAIAVGDFLLSRAFGLLASIGAEEETAVLAAASTALARGELAQRAQAFDLEVGESDYFERCSLKTARLFEAACEIGPQSVGDPGAEALAAFGVHTGLAFQLLDDVLDITGPPERTGKARGTDLLDGTVTLPLIWARRIDPEIASDGLEDLTADQAEIICGRIVASGAIERVRSRASEEIADAKTALRRSDLEASRVELFELIADGVVERYS